MRPGSSPRQSLSPSAPSCPMRQAIAAALPVLLALILLPAIAFASPPDPSWIAGIYDGADGDDIVSLVYATSAANTAALPHIGPLPCLPEISLDGITRRVPCSRFTGGPRSPPPPRSPEHVHVFSSLPPPASGSEAPVTLPPTITKSRLAPRGDLLAVRVPVRLSPKAQKQFMIATTMYSDMGMQGWQAQPETGMEGLS